MLIDLHYNIIIMQHKEVSQIFKSANVRAMFSMLSNLNSNLMEYRQKMDLFASSQDQ